MMSRALTCGAAVILLAGCTASGITDAPRPTHAHGSITADSAVNLIECPTSTTTSASGLVTPLGGSVSSGGTTITVPPGAVLVPTTIAVTVPASNYMEVDISVPGVEHFRFESPVTVTVSYARCTRADIDKTPLAAWHIDGATKTPLEYMGGSDDKAVRSVTFSTGHLSGYALAN